MDLEVKMTMTMKMIPSESWDLPAVIPLGCTIQPSKLFSAIPTTPKQSISLTDVVGEFFSPFCLNYNPHSKIDEYLSGSNMPCLTFREPFIFYYCFIVSRTVVAIIIIIIIIVIVVIIYADVILFDLRDWYFCWSLLVSCSLWQQVMKWGDWTCPHIKL